MQRRIEQADRDRQPGHDPEELDEVGALHRQELGERGAPALFVVGQDHLAHGDDAVGLEEHVLGAAQADALGAELARGAASSGVSALARTFSRRTRVGPAHQRARNRPTAAGWIVGTAPSMTFAGRAVEGDQVALGQLARRRYA